MKVINLLIPLLFLIYFLIPHHKVFSQNISIADTSKAIKNHLDGIVKSECSPNYRVISLIDVDERVLNAEYRVYQAFGYIFDDPENQLKNSFIILAKRFENPKYVDIDTVFIGIISQDMLIWNSKKLFIESWSISLTGFGDLNNDGVTDILFSSNVDTRGALEALWILTPDSSGEKFLNKIDAENQSEIVGAAGCFEIRPKIGQVVKTIVGIKPYSPDLEEIIYTWNGEVFEKR